MRVIFASAVLVSLTISAHLNAESNNASTSLSSGTQRVALVELFTSEGCSSCPPADRWMSQLKSNPGLWKEFVPLAFHVDYWDYIGWRDRFASGKYSDRQRRYQHEGGTRVVYTPGFFSDGIDWRGWRSGDYPQSDGVSIGDLNVLVDKEAVAVHFSPPRKLGVDLAVHIAILGMNLETEVQAGENKGRSLRHDFVVLGMKSARLDESSSGYKAITSLPAISAESSELAVVAWVSEQHRQTPIQSVGGLLAKN